MKNKTTKYAYDTHDGRMPKGRPKISTQLEKTNLTLDRLVKKAAMKLAASRRQSLSSLVTELLERQVKLGRDGAKLNGARSGRQVKLGHNGAKLDGKI